MITLPVARFQVLALPVQQQGLRR
jgi:hypothetical protein